jgi:hypothetical protein
MVKFGSSDRPACAVARAWSGWPSSAKAAARMNVLAGARLVIVAQILADAVQCSPPKHGHAGRRDVSKAMRIVWAFPKRRGNLLAGFAGVYVGRRCDFNIPDMMSPDVDVHQCGGPARAISLPDSSSAPERENWRGWRKERAEQSSHNHLSAFSRHRPARREPRSSNNVERATLLTGSPDKEICK